MPELRHIAGLSIDHALKMIEEAPKGIPLLAIAVAMVHIAGHIIAIAREAGDIEDETIEKLKRTFADRVAAKSLPSATEDEKVFRDFLAKLNLKV